jgi:hypothetical protein
VAIAALPVGVLVGLLCGVFSSSAANHYQAITVVSQDSDCLSRFPKDTSFIIKNEFRRKLREPPNESRVVIARSRALFIDHHIVEIVERLPATGTI